MVERKLFNQVITLNRKKYAVGLFWQPMAVGTVARKYARHLAHDVDKKLNLFTEYRAMIALGSGRMGHRSGMLSAAAEVIDSLTEYNSFLAVFAVGRFYYLIAVRNGVILRDALFDNQDAARTEYVKLSEIPDWNALFAPGVWGMPRAVERNLSDLIGARAHAVLRPISRMRSGSASVVLLVIFAALVYHFFREPIAQTFVSKPKIAQINPELAAEYKRQIEEQNKQLDAQFEIEKAPPPEPIVLPYDYLPNVADRAAVCYQAIGFLMQPVTGWNQVTASCDQTHATVQFRRSFGTLGEFYQIAAQLMPGVFVTEQNENLLNVRATLPGLDVGASQDERDAETVLRDIQTRFQEMDAEIDAQIVTDVLSNGVESVNLNIVEIAVASKLVPMQFMQVFDDFGGVYMARCEWNATRRIWNYEVIIYAK